MRTGSTTIPRASPSPPRPHPSRRRSRSTARSCSSPSPSRPPRRPLEMTEHRFQTPGPIELVVRIPTGDIDIETIEGDESLVSLDGDDKLVDLTDVRQEGRRIIVELKGKKAFGITISIGDFSFGSARLRVRARVPHGSSAVFATASADMKVRGRLASLEAKSASGDLVVNGEIEHDAIVKTVSGDVRLERVGGELTVQTVSGDVSAQSVRGSIEPKTGSGDLRGQSLPE